ncbi:MAG: peroxiredoxin-like family protein [Bacteroidota bacterium]
MTFEERLLNLKKKIEGGLSAEAINIMHSATKALQETGIEDNILKAGEKAPEFTLHNQEGNLVSSKDVLKKGPIIVTFYRGVWCPYCNLDLSNLKRHLDQFEENNATLVSISPQIAKYNAQIVERQRLPFGVLSDEGNQVAAKFGLRWEMVDPLKSLYNDQFQISLPKYNGEDSWTLPMPARYLIDTDGIIRYAEAKADYTNRPNPDELIEAF